MAGEIVILKFGSSVLRGRGDLPAAVHEIYRWYRTGQRVVAVVSAIGETTELLLAEAREISPEPEPHALAELLATGERHSAALLGIALDRAGIPARVVSPRDVQLFASGPTLDSEPISINGEKIRALLDETPVLVLPGFFGHEATGRLHLLGRGGSDLTAVFLATALRATRCRLIKDVDGVYESDPALASATPPRRYARLSYADALEHAAPLIQSKAVQLLQRFSREAEIAALGESHASIVSAHAATFESLASKPPSKVLLLGLGTVGFGVYQRLQGLPKHFRTIGALIRNPTKHLARGVPADLLHTRHQSLAELEPDLVVEALSDDNLAVSLVRVYLAYGIPVISASKALIADAGPSLQQLAREQHSSLHYSAAVGGSTPMLEAVERARATDEIRELCAVLNGTCNFLLERCGAGVSFDAALREAQSLGLAEADPSEDLSGRDSARKLKILARHAFDEELRDIEIEPVNEEEVVGNLAHLPPRSSLHLVCRAWRDGPRLFGRVQIEALDAEHPLGTPRGDWNALQIGQVNGPGITVRGRGAGRWPTTEAIVADLLAQRFGRAAHSTR